MSMRTSGEAPTGAVGHPTPNHPQWQRPDEGAPYGGRGDRRQRPNEVPNGSDLMKHSTAAGGERWL